METVGFAVDTAVVAISAAAFGWWTLVELVSPRLGRSVMLMMGGVTALMLVALGALIADRF